MSGTEEANIKKIQLTGEAALAASGGAGETRKKRRASARQTRKGGGGEEGAGAGGGAATVQKLGHTGGGGTSPGTLVQLTASHVPGSANARQPVGVNSALTQKGAPAAAAPAPATGGASASSAAASNVKVILAAPKKKKAKVVLAAARPTSGGSGAATARKPGATARKIKVSMRGLSRKITKAVGIRTKATSDTLEVIKKELHKAGLVKADTKAPETILRQMYADYLTLKNRAL